MTRPNPRNVAMIYRLRAAQQAERAARFMRSIKGNPTRPVGRPESDAADRWECRRSLDCRAQPCDLSIRRARLSRIHSAYGRRRRGRI